MLLCTLTTYIYFVRGADIYAEDANGNSPMMNAIAHGHKELIKIFFNFNYTVDIAVKRDKMLLEWAIEQGHISLIEVQCTKHVCDYCFDLELKQMFDSLRHSLSCDSIRIPQKV